MTSDEVVDIFVKAERQDLIETITPLIHAERMAVLSSFVGVDPALVKSLPLTDEDYRALNQHKERFDISFRRFVKAWTSADDEGKADAYDDWRAESASPSGFLSESATSWNSPMPCSKNRG